MRVEKSKPSDCVVDLTYENMVQHEARYESHVVFYRTNAFVNQAMHADGLLLMGGVTPSSASRPKTCGLALAMVAIFCYFPGISMVISIGRVGITNQTVIGIIFTSVAVILTVTSTVLCLRSRYQARKMREPDRTNSPIDLNCVNTEQNSHLKKLLSSRGDYCSEKRVAHSHLIPNDVLCECDKVELANRIAKSFSLRRYFANLETATGPFDFDKEAMDRATERCIWEGNRTLQDHTFSRPTLQKGNSSSIDSAIDVGYDDYSMNGVTVV
uniref:uncharacterized protein LOC120347306 n=1 Tax=Styela clava TaxID=7725 RepID=UPI0019395B0E|nr:uncharacterized protein LOC120347306 [Styela clava]